MGKLAKKLMGGESRVPFREKRDKKSSEFGQGTPHPLRNFCRALSGGEEKRGERRECERLRVET